MTCNNSNSNINKTFILEPLSITGGPSTLTASTALYTSQVKSYRGNTTITMDINFINFSHDIYVDGNVSAKVYYGDGSQLSGVAKHDYYTTAVTLNDAILYFSRNDQLSAYTIDLRNLLFTGGSGNCITDLFTDNIHTCSTGITIHNDIVPKTDNTILIGQPYKRFRELNVYSGNTTIWKANQKIETPVLDLGIDSQGNLRQITADNSIINNDILLGGNY